MAATVSECPWSLPLLEDVHIGAAPTASADPTGIWLGMMPAGYGPDSCRLVDNPPQFALVVLECGNNSMPGEPTHARYALSADPGAVSDVFGGYAKLPFRSPIPCGSGDTAAGTWSEQGRHGRWLGRMQHLRGLPK